MKTLLTSLLSCVVLAGVGHAAPPAPAPSSPPAPSDARKKEKPKVIELEALVIEGKVAKPQVFYVLGRSRVQYENLKMQRNFVDKIVEGAKANPF